nr:hypothetical protein BaRGS_015347 [Batillaria attramentaria]
MGWPVVAACLLLLLSEASAEPRQQFVLRLLSVYGGGKMQASRADRDQNGNISENEFLQSILFFADNDVRDRRVTLAEFIDGYRREYKLPAELIVIMFDILDDLNNDGGGGMGRDDFRDNRNNKFFDMFFQFGKGDNVFRNTARNKGDNLLTQRDFSYRDFVGSIPVVFLPGNGPGNPWDREFDYERWFHNVDRNNDSLVSFNELKDEFRRYSRDGRVARARWAERNMNVYSDREWLANVVFDYWDKNRDLTLDDIDIGLVLREADRNRDMRVTTIEFHRFMEKYNKRARRRLATPIRPVMYDCPSPWWQSFGCRPRVDATRAAMDMDDNFDGWITHGELRKRLSYYDRNGDGWASRFEVMTFETLRYGVKGPVASLMFDIYDRNGDGRYDHGDLQFMLTVVIIIIIIIMVKGTGVSCVFCDARRAVLDLVRLAEMFRFLPQAQEGDCTGKDWRGSGWYSPFDWRQRNRVPENFLQWSYLQKRPADRVPAARIRSFFDQLYKQGGPSRGGRNQEAKKTAEGSADNAGDGRQTGNRNNWPWTWDPNNPPTADLFVDEDKTDSQVSGTPSPEDSKSDDNSADAAQNATDVDSATLEEGEDKDHDEVARQMTHTFRTPADWLSYARDMNRCDGGNQWAQQSDMNDLNAYGVGWGGWDGWNDGQSEMAAVWGTGQEGLQAGQDKTRCFVYGETILGRETVSITDGIYSQPYSGAGSQWPQWMTRNRGSYYSPRWWSSSGNNQMWPTRTIPGPVWSGGQMSGFPRPDSDYRQRFFPVSSGQDGGRQGQDR